MAKIEIALAHAEATAFTFRKDADKERTTRINFLRDRIAGDTAELNQLLREEQNGHVAGLVTLLKGINIHANEKSPLLEVTIPGVANAIAEVDASVKPTQSRSYAGTLLTKEDGEYAFTVLNQKVELFNYGGRKPNERNRHYSVYQHVRIGSKSAKEIHAALDTAKKHAHILATKEIHVDEKHVS